MQRLNIHDLPSRCLNEKHRPRRAKLLVGLGRKRVQEKEILGEKYKVLSGKDVERIHNASLQTFIGRENHEIYSSLRPSWRRRV